MGNLNQDRETQPKLKDKVLGRMFVRHQGPTRRDIPDPGPGISQTKNLCKAPFSVVLDRTGNGPRFGSEKLYARKLWADLSFPREKNPGQNWLQKWILASPGKWGKMARKMGKMARAVNDYLPLGPLGFHNCTNLSCDQESPRQTQPKKGQCMNFPRGKPEEKFDVNRACFPKQKHQNSHKNGRNS